MELSPLSALARPLRSADIMTKPPEAFVVRAFAFACKIVHLHATLNRIPRFPFSISRQLLRSGTSIGANLEEARSASSRRDLAARFEVALREARETHYWLRLIAATSLAQADLLAPLTREAHELISILHASVKKLRAEEAATQPG